MQKTKTLKKARTVRQGPTRVTARTSGGEVDLNGAPELAAGAAPISANLVKGVVKEIFEEENGGF